jgi:hypothetical protein
LLRIAAHAPGVVVEISVPTPAALMMHAWFAAVAAALPTLHDFPLCFVSVLLALKSSGRSPMNMPYDITAAFLLRGGSLLSGVRCSERSPDRLGRRNLCFV